MVNSSCLYRPGTTVLSGEDGSPTSPGHPGTFQMRHSIAADTEHSGNSEESHETNDSGRYSHESTDEIHLCSVISTSPPTPDSFNVQECVKDPALCKHGKPPSVCSWGALFWYTSEHSYSINISEIKIPQARYSSHWCLFEGQWQSKKESLWNLVSPIKYITFLQNVPLSKSIDFEGWFAGWWMASKLSRFYAICLYCKGTSSSLFDLCLPQLVTLWTPFRCFTYICVCSPPLSLHQKYFLNVCFCLYVYYY